jgi:hypothetical protein
VKKIVPEELETYRIRDGDYGSDASFGMMGAFKLFSPKDKEPLLVMSSGADRTKNDTGWEHVSVSAQFSTPTWEEMCWVKDLFWREDETVVQYHPRRSEYVDFHPYCLHLFKPIGIQLPIPPMLLVGPTWAKKRG